MCITPITLKNKVQRLTYSNRPTSVVPCGRCISCLKRKSNAWAFRLEQELKRSTSAIFLTLTYEDEHLPRENITNTYINYDTGEITDYIYKDVPVLRKKDYQDFTKRLRRTLEKQSQTKIKYYACGEYGSNNTQRPHYHAIIFNLPQNYLQDFTILNKIWNKGNIYLGDCNANSIRYVTKYIMKGKDNKQTTKPKEFSLMSKKMGLNHLTPQMLKYYQQNPTTTVTLAGGVKTPLPRYFRQKLYNDVELHKLRIEALQKSLELDEKLFTNPQHKETWKKDQIRKHEKINRLERQLI